MMLSYLETKYNNTVKGQKWRAVLDCTILFFSALTDYDLPLPPHHIKDFLTFFAVSCK